MIREALTMLAEGSSTISEISRRLGVTEAKLKDRLEMMVRMGYLETMALDPYATDPSRGCPGCLLSGRCRGEVCSAGGPVVGYRMTDKGRRVVSRGTDGDGGAAGDGAAGDEGGEGH